MHLRASVKYESSTDYSVQVVGFNDGNSPYSRPRSNTEHIQMVLRGRITEYTKLNRPLL